MDTKEHQAERHLVQKRRRAKVGEGGPTRKLKEIIEASAKEHFDAKTVADINIFLPPPVWRRCRCDVHLIDGNMRVDGRLVSFGSWACVSELIKYHRVTWGNDWPVPDMSPIYETRRTRTRANLGVLHRPSGGADTPIAS